MYYDNISETLKEYFKILSPEFPNWLHEYINTPEMLRIGKISMDCGCYYTNIFPSHPWHTNLDHSVGVALIIWNFTKNKKQTLAGLFHDIATPVFKHCIDFMNGDSMKQESTEERTHDIIKNSKEIMALLKRDGIKLEEVDDYKLYPIADNDSPRLSADRFEYNFCCGLIMRPVWTLENIKKCYNDIIIVKNEDGIDELAFATKEIAELYISIVSKLWPWWVNDADRTSMQFIADLCKSLKELNYLTINDLYTLSEKEVIEKFKNCDKYISESFNKFQNATKVYRSDKKIKDKYCINVKGKRRYVNPLVKIEDTVKRIYDISEKAKNDIDEYMKIPIEGYTYLNFNFIPIERK